jgi:3-methyladenine DNA glycosylase AlkD
MYIKIKQGYEKYLRGMLTVSKSFDSDEYLRKVTEALAKEANSENAKEMKRYMKDNFEFFGVDATLRREVTRGFMQRKERPPYDALEGIAKKLWDFPEREYQYFGMELLEKYKNEFDENIIDLFEYIIINKSWWDTVDEISKKLVGNYFIRFPGNRDKSIEKWVKSGNIWLQRNTLLFQLRYKENTDVKLLFSLVKRLKDIDEFFIQKAIGWALREYSKIDPEVIEGFVDGHKLSPLSYREAKKIIKKGK